MTLRYVQSTKGKSKLVHDGHIYVHDRSAGIKTYWKWDLHCKYHCKGRVITENDVIKRTTAHNHAGDAARIEASVVENRLRENAR